MTKDYPPKDLSKKELLEEVLKLQKRSEEEAEEIAKMKAEKAKALSGKKDNEKPDIKQAEKALKQIKVDESLIKNKEAELVNKGYKKDAAKRIAGVYGAIEAQEKRESILTSNPEIKDSGERLESVRKSIKESQKELTNLLNDINNQEDPIKVAKSNTFDFVNQQANEALGKSPDKTETEAEKAIRLSAEAKAVLEAKENADKGKEGSKYDFVWKKEKGDSDLAYTYEEGTFVFEINGAETKVFVSEEKTFYKKHPLGWKIMRLNFKEDGEDVLKEKPTWSTWIQTENEEIKKKLPKGLESETREEAIKKAEEMIEEGLKIKFEEEKRFMGIKEPENLLSMKEWLDFVDKNEVPEHTINNIVDKIRRGEKLSDNEEAIRQSRAQLIEEKLKTPKEEKDSDSKPGDKNTSDNIRILNTFPPYAYTSEAKQTSPEPTPPLTPEKKTITPIEETTQILEAKEKLEKARENYINEYKKCKKEAQKQTLIDKTRNATFNILAGIKNLTRKEKIKYHKEVIKPENYFTEEAIDAKNIYAKAKIEMGNEMFNQKKSELEKAGLSGDELKQALEQYKAVEILGKTIIDERQKVIEAKAEKPALLKRMLDGWQKIKPSWKRVAISTLVFLPLAASGALGASAIAVGGIYWGVAGLYGTKFLASMLIGAAVGHAAKGIDWAKKGSDLKFAQNQYDKKIELQEKFSKEEISSEEYEKEIDNLEEIEKKRNRNRLILKGVVGAALAITAGYFAYDAMGNGLTHLEGTENHIDTISGPDEGGIKPGATFDNDTKTGIKDGTEAGAGVNIKHEAVEATANNGQGAISTIRELQENLKLEYKDGLENAPASVKHILETDAHKLAQEFGMYKPGEDAESLLIKSGSSFKVDGSGNLSFHDVDTNSDVALLKSTEIKIENPIEGKMVDSDHSGINESNENTINKDQTSDVNQTQVEPKVVDLNNPNAVTDGQVAPRIIDLNKTNIDSVTQITPKIVDLNNLDTGVKPDGLNTEILAPTAVKELSQDYIHRLFPNEKMMSNWHYVDKNISAERLIELSNKGEINPSFQSLGHHIKNLSELSGLKPDGGIPGIIPAEKISDFTERAYEKINELGKIDEIKVYDNSNIENAVTNIKKTNLEEIIKSTPGVYEADINQLKDLKEITRGYEDIPPGQLPLKMIMEKVSGKGLHSIVSEDIAGTKTVAMMSSNFKMNNIMSTVGGKTYGDYYFNKVLPNGNIKLIHIKFYK